MSFFRPFDVPCDSFPYLAANRGIPKSDRSGPTAVACRPRPVLKDTRLDGIDLDGMSGRNGPSSQAVF